MPMIDLTKVFTISEASEKFGISSETLKNYCRGSNRGGYKYPPKFTPEECRRSGRVYLITYDGLKRLFHIEED